MFVGLAIGAGLLLFVLRRLFAKKASPAEDLADRISEQAVAFLGDDPLAAGRSLLTQAVLPEVKPLLRLLLKEIEASVAQGFTRAERAIDDL